MQESIIKIKETLKLIKNLEDKFKIKPNKNNNEPLLYCGVIKSDHVPEIAKEVEKFFGKPYKPAGKTAILKNFFDRFVKKAGGARKEQTLYRKDINDFVCMYCAFWPWGSNPISTSVRIGVICFGADERQNYIEALKNDFT